MPASASPAACKCAAVIVIIIAVGVVAANAIQRSMSPAKNTQTIQQARVMQFAAPGAVDAAPLSR